MLASQQVVLAASDTDQTVGVWDVHTGTFLTAYKGNTSGRNALVSIGEDYLVAAQAGKAQALHIWSWQKDQVHQRSFVPEAIASIACTRDGVYCVAGSEKGNLYIWEVGSGRLLRWWPGHYKKVRVLAFTDDGSLLLSGGEDAVVSAWLLMDLLDTSSKHMSWSHSPQPLHSWSEHTLPVTGLFIGAGGINAIAASVSLDRSCKILSLAQGHLLRTISLPTALHSIAADHWEHSLYLGSADGRIFEASLIGKRADQVSSAASPQLPPAVAALQDSGIQTLAGHCRTVTCLASTSDGYILVSGSEDGSLRMWDLQSRQVLRVIQAKGPITNILVIDKPPQMSSGRGTDDSGRKGPKRIQPLAPFSKHVDASAASKPWEGPPIILDGTQPYRGAIVEAGLLLNPAEHMAGSLRDHAESVGASAEEFQSLSADNLRLEQQLKGAAKTIAELRAANAKLHAFVVESA